MQLVEEWLSTHNLLILPLEDGARLQGEALRYAVVTFMLRPHDLPVEVVALLAEEYFNQVYQGVGVN